MNKSIKLIITVLAVFCFLVSAAGNSFAQSDTSDGPVTVNGHKFVINSKIGSPFTNTTFKTLLGGGQTINLQIPDIVIKGITVKQVQGEIAYTNLAFEYQQEIRDWLAFYGEIKLVGRLGTESGSLISQGVNVVSGYNLGWKIKVLQSKELMLSTNLNIMKSSFITIDLPGFIQGVIDSGKITPGNKIVNYTPLLRGGIGLTGAYAFNETFGATAKVYVDYGESTERFESDVFNYVYGIVVDANLYPKLNVPLGFLAGFYHSSLPNFKESTSRDPNELLFQLNYTGKKYLNLGVEINYQWYLPDRLEKSVNSLTFNLHSSIYF